MPINCPLSRVDKMTDFNVIDYMILTIFAFSIFAGFMRGLLKEVISLLTWVAACVVSSMFSGTLATYISQGPSAAYVQSVINQTATKVGMNPDQSMSMLTILASFGALFFITLLVGSLVGSLVTTIVAQSGGLAFTNRLSGAIFGVVRGYIVIIIGMFFLELTPIGTQAMWTQSQFVNSFQPVVSWFSQIVDPAIEALKAKAQQATQGVSGPAAQAVQAISGLLQQTPTNIFQGLAPLKAP